MSRTGMTLEERFWSKVNKNGEGGCWIWTSATNTDGYGKFELDYKMIAAHRLSFELFNGPIPRGKYICHRCNRRNCVNPDHIYAGTQRQNVDDMLRDDRHSNGAKRRLTGQEVAEIRSSAASGIPFKVLCEQFDRTFLTISRIVNGHAYSKWDSPAPVVG